MDNPIVTFGFGPNATVGYVVTFGFDIGTPVVVTRTKVYGTGEVGQILNGTGRTGQVVTGT